MASTLERPLLERSQTSQITAPVVATTKKVELRGEVLIVAALIVIGLVAHGFNMFSFPAFTLLDDEGIFAGNARAVLTSGQMSSYTYIYDHAPGGWILLAGWQLITGGLHTFGSPIDSGRILMLLLHLAMIPMLYQICRKLGANVVATVGVTLLFSVSPLAIFYQRMVLVDIIMMFWVLLSLNILLDGWGRLSRVVLSGICFGLAVVCSEAALVLLPAMLFLSMQQRYKHQSRFGLVGWLLPALIVMSFYPLYALLNGELFPTGQQFIAEAGQNLPTGAGRVSLIDTLFNRFTRDGGGALNFENQFWRLVRNDWATKDAVLLLGGFVAVLVNLRRGLNDRRALAAGLLGGSVLLYLARGGVVLSYQIVFIIPFLCLNIALVLTPVLDKWPRKITYPAFGAVLALLIAAYWTVGGLTTVYAEQPATAGREAISWIKANLPASSRIISRDDLWTDLREAGSGGPAFPNVHPHWKVGSDPAVKLGVFDNDWHNVDYLIMTPNLQDEFARSKNTIALEAFKNAQLVKRWEAPAGQKGIHPNQIVELWKVNKAGTSEIAVLRDSNDYIKSHFERNGAYMQPNGSVASEAQANALLRAVWSGSKTDFYRIWSWTRDNMELESGLLAREWRTGSNSNEGGLLPNQWSTGKVVDQRTATDADTDTALALLMASKQWNDPILREAGVKMVRAIWQNEIVTVKDKPYVMAGNWAAQGETVAINPSMFAPYAYHIFAEVDPTHDWFSVIEANYQLLFDAAASPLGQSKSAGLPPDWVGLNKTTGEITPLKLDKTPDTTGYGYEAPRAYWRIALDWQWSKDNRAETFLKQASFLKDEVNNVLKDGLTKKNRVSAIYRHDGAVVQEESSTVGTAGAIAALLTLDPTTANTLYAGLLGSFGRTADSAAWGRPDDLYSQEWGWFGTALYANGTPNLWKQTAK